jgi:hypothetical protein
MTDYVRGLSELVYWEKDRWFVDLPGSPSFAFQRVGPSTPTQRAAWLELAHESNGAPRPRWIEVWPSKVCCYVMTREMDHITNVIADGLAKLLARAFGGTIEAG